jgi:hypothetical protein
MRWTGDEMRRFTLDAVAVALRAVRVVDAHLDEAHAGVDGLGAGDQRGAPGTRCFGADEQVAGNELGHVRSRR